MNFRIAALLVTSLGAWPVPGAAQSRVFYVDYAGGSDAADGRSPETAWKHGPGDPASVGASRRLKLLPGDEVRFRGGVRYRGSMLPDAAGTADAPVVFDGSAWGPMRAIIDGSEPLQGVRRCRSAADCLGSPHWANLWRADLPAAASWTDFLFVHDKVLQPAQYPALSVADSDKPEKFLPIPKAELQKLLAGRIDAALPAGLGQGQPVLALWVNPNLIAFSTEIAVSTEGVQFAPGGQWVNANFKPYTNRDSRFSLMNLPAMVNRAGLFAVSPADRVAIFWPPAVGSASTAVSYQPSVSTGSRRYGINTSKATNIVVRGFSFTSFAAEPKNMSSGAAILGRSSKAGITIADNSFRSFVGLSGPAVVHMAFARDLRIERNQFVDTPWTSGIMVDNSAGPTVVRCNSFSDIGRTGIRFSNVANGQILGNRLTRVYSVHGNAISAYNDSRNVRIAGNVVTASIRPLTLHGIGNGSPYFTEGTPGVTVSDNVLIGTDSVNGALTSYGSTPNLVVTGNFLYSNPNAMKIAGTETGFVATGNQLVGKVVQPKASQLFQPAGNIFHDPEGSGAELVARMIYARPPASYCG